MSFLSVAESLSHPFDAISIVPWIKDAIKYCNNHSPNEVAKEWDAWLDKWTFIQAGHEKKPFQFYHEDVAFVNGGKDPIFYERLLNEYYFPATSLVQFLRFGVPQFGPFPESGLFSQND